MEQQSEDPFVVRYSEKVLRQERRSRRTYGIFGVIASLCGLAISYAGYRSHTWVDVGPRGQTFMLPPWATTLISVAWLVGSIFLLFKARSPHRQTLN